MEFVKLNNEKYSCSKVGKSPFNWCQTLHIHNFPNKNVRRWKHKDFSIEKIQVCWSAVIFGCREEKNYEYKVSGTNWNEIKLPLSNREI